LMGRYTQLVASHQAAPIQPTSLAYIKNDLDEWEGYFETDIARGESSSAIPKEELLRWQAGKFSGKSWQLKSYFSPLLSILFFLHQEGGIDREKYYKLLDYQVSETEKYVLFYFFLTYDNLFTNEEKEFT